MHAINGGAMPQASGLLVKTDPKSVFIRFDRGSSREDSIFSAKPTISVKRRNGSYADCPITVLQVMLAHDNGYLCEAVIDYDE